MHNNSSRPCKVDGPANVYRGGGYNQNGLSSKGRVREQHHMFSKVQIEKMDNWVDYDIAPVIEMAYKDHFLTKTHGSVFFRKYSSQADKAAAIAEYTRYKNTISELVSQGDAGLRKALAMELRDVRSIARNAGDPRRYNKAIQEMLEYARSLNLIPSNPGVK